MASYVRDIPRNCLVAEAIPAQTFTATVTGNGIDMLTGDGLVNCLVQVSTISGKAAATAITVQVQQSTLSNSGFANITGATVAISSAGMTGFTFNRDSRYLLAICQFGATTVTGAVTFIEQLKTF